MQIELLGAEFLIAMLLVGVMGFAIQRGATCTVAAVGELLHKRRADRLRSMLEAALWVSGGILIARALHLSAIMPAGFGIGWNTIAGAALLGFGAWLNGACVFGAIARFGSGEWSYSLTPAGFFAGALGFQWFTRANTAPHPLSAVSPVLAATHWLAMLFAIFVIWRVASALLTKPASRPLLPWLHENIWAPGAATVVIGITFVFVLFLMGATWAYTDVLAEFAGGVSMNALPRALLLLALLVGAVVGGVTAKRFAHTAISYRSAARCLLGGALMGLGSLMIPGSNDGLILIGMPLLWPHAWVAFGVMCLTIAAAMTISGRVTARDRARQDVVRD
jgi:toxin CptA